MSNKLKLIHFNRISIKLALLIIAFLFTPFEAKTNNINQNLKWEKVDSKIFLEEINELNQIEQDTYNFVDYYQTMFNPKVRSVGRNITIDNVLYPEISNYVPNAFVADPYKRFNISTKFINKTRSSTCKGSLVNCGDLNLNLNYGLINLNKYSLGINYTIQSLSDRRAGGTEFGEGQSMGLKLAKEISDNWSIAIGGENIIHMDEHTDLGRNFYLISSSYHSLNGTNNWPLLFLNYGIGTDFFGYKGNGNLGTISCLGNNTLTGSGTNDCSVGFISSANILFNERVGIVAEWFGYGFGVGISSKPLKKYPITFSIYATDFLGNFPKYINDGNSSKCSYDICETRFYGNISISI